MTSSLRPTCASRSLTGVFTGIVRERAPVLSFEDGRLVVESRLKPRTGDSVAVDGVCLTVVERGDGRLAFDVAAETLSRAKPFGAEVNVEPAVHAGDPLGGHYVQGHVDGVGRVRCVEGERLVIEAPQPILRYCVEKGSIAADGVSLTIASLEEDAFEVALVPHTLAQTTLGSLKPGDAVNLEADVLAKYVERLLGATVPTLPLERSVQTDHGRSPRS
jgi:riboflavin synthase